MHQQTTCSQCGQPHPLDESEGAFRLPDAAARLPTWRRWLTVRSDGNYCAIRGRRFVRGLLGFPLHDREDSYCWGIWVEVDRATWNQLVRTRYEEGREAAAPCRGVLANELPLFGQPTTGLPVVVHVQPVGSAPHFTVAEPDHPVAREQATGIDAGRAMAFTHFALTGLRD